MGCLTARYCANLHLLRATWRGWGSLGSTSQKDTLIRVSPIVWLQLELGAISPILVEFDGLPGVFGRLRNRGCVVFRPVMVHDAVLGQTWVDSSAARTSRHVRLSLNTTSASTLHISLYLILSKAQRQGKFEVIWAHVRWALCRVATSHRLISLSTLRFVKTIGVTLGGSVAALSRASRIRRPIIVRGPIRGGCSGRREKAGLGARLVTRLVHFILDFWLSNWVVQLHDHVVVQVVLVRRLALFRDARPYYVSFDAIGPTLTPIIRILGYTCCLMWGHIGGETRLVSVELDSSRGLSSIFGHLWPAFSLASLSNSRAHIECFGLLFGMRSHLHRLVQLVLLQHGLARLLRFHRV